MTNQLLNILWDWRFVLIVAAAFLIWYVADWQNARVKIYQFMLLAKSKAKDMVLSSGQEQEDWVVEKIWAVLPLKFKIFMTEDTLREIVRWLYRQAKDKLEDGQVNP